MYCGGEETSAEHLTQVAAGIYGVTDYAYSTLRTEVVLWDDGNGVPAEGWEDNLLSALPGVVVFGEDGDEQVAYLSRGCCAQTVLAGSLPDGPLPNAACSGGNNTAPTPEAYCIDMLDGTGGGGCVFPCDEDGDCADESFESCDLDHPDPYGRGAGVCRYRTMEDVPTHISDILGALPEGLLESALRDLDALPSRLREVIPDQAR